MFYTLIATIVAGFAGAGIVLLLRLVFKSRIPKWATPVAAGGCMIAATIGSEYAWYENTAAVMPPGFEVVVTRDRQTWWQPWTYVSPYVDGFVAVNHASTRTNDAAPGIHLVNVYVFGRWAATTEIPSLIDCPNTRRADVIDGLDFAADGAPVNVAWTEVAADDPLVRAVCDRPAAS